MRLRLVFALGLLLVVGCSSTQQRTSSSITTYGHTNVSSNQPASTEQNRNVHPRPTTAASGNFDYYLLTLSWSPEYCHSHPEDVQCTSHSTFVLHGLWPENNDGTYPQNCSNAPGPSNPSQYSDIYPDVGLLKHEWSTHGTCSGLTADQFFTTARNAFHSIAIPAAFQKLSAQGSMTPAQIMNSFEQSNPAVASGDLSVSCGNNYLTAVQVCLDKSLHPVACGTIKSCRANIVRVPAP